VRNPSRSIVANPVLVGAVTVLITVVACFLAYNATRGLPFVPHTLLHFDIANGSNLLPGNEVREGGARIGIVDRMVPRRLRDGTVGARVTIKLDAEVPALPRDSTVRLRPRSVLGLRYVEVTRGREDGRFRTGETIPSSQASFANELEELHRMYDARTRRGIRQGLRGFGNALSSRGYSLNTTIEAAPRFLRHLEPVMRTLADDSTQLSRFFRELGDFTRVVAPLADTYRDSFRRGARVFEAWSRFPDRVQGTIERAAPTMRVGIRSFAVQRPFLTDFAAMNRSLARAAEVLPNTLPRITGALRTGVPVLQRSGEYNEALGEALGALDALMRDPATPYALRGLTRLVDIVDPLITFVGPYVTVCNYWNYAWTHLGEHLTEPDPTGGSQRTLLNQAPRTRNPSDPSIGSIGARRPSNGEEVVSGARVNLHTNVYTAAVGHDGQADCESGQRGYLERLNTYSNDPSLRIVTDPHIPGDQGTTWTGRPRVPEGQTFSRLPTMGPELPRELDR
jgi:ABC-type transporter Mla subunit MlaD